MKKIIIEKVKQIVGNDWLYLDDAICVKKTPHSPAYKIWAVCVKDDQIYLMDSNQRIFHLEENDINHNLIVASLYQRIMLINNKTA